MELVNKLNFTRELPPRLPTLEEECKRGTEVENRGRDFPSSFPHLISILSTTHLPLPASSLLTIWASLRSGLHRRVCQNSSEKQGGEGIRKETSGERNNMTRWEVMALRIPISGWDSAPIMEFDLGPSSLFLSLEALLSVCIFPGMG